MSSSTHHDSATIPPIEETDDKDTTTTINNDSWNDDDTKEEVRTMDPNHTITSHTFGGPKGEYVEVVPARIQPGAPLTIVTRNTSLHSVQSAPPHTTTTQEESPLQHLRPHTYHHRREERPRQLRSLFRASESSDGGSSQHHHHGVVVDPQVELGVQAAQSSSGATARTGDDHHSKTSTDTDDCPSFAGGSDDDDDANTELSRNTIDDPIHLRLARRVPFADGGDETNKSSSPDSKRRRTGTAFLMLGLLVLVLATIAGAVVGTTRTPNTSATRNKNLLVTATELEQHNSPDDCWLLIQGRVLDVSKFDHPGGRDMLTPYCGQDATTPYRMQHPDSLLSTVGEPMVVGVAIASLPTNPPLAPPTAAPTFLFPNNITSEELAIHNDPDADCWIAVDGQVYNYTEFSVTAKDQNTTISFCGTNAPFALIDEETYKRMGTLIVVAPPNATSSPANGTITNTVAPEATPNTSAPSTNMPSPPAPSKTPTPAPSTASPTTTSPTSGPTEPPTSTSPTKSPEVVVGRSELALHDDPDDDCWIAIHGTVYDLTKYVPYHPGGAGNLTAHCGTDGSPAYAKVHTVSNLNYARAYTVGSYEPEQTLPPTAAPTTSQTILLSEVATHNTTNDCFLVLHGTVYDLTAFAPGHPGGSGTIYNHCGMDGTESFGMHHNVTTLDVMAKPYVLGRLVID